MSEPGFSLWVNQISDMETDETEGMKEGAANPKEVREVKAAEMHVSMHAYAEMHLQYQQKCICRLRASTEDLTSAVTE